MKNTFLAIDLGTDRCRAVIGELIDGILGLKEIHSFENEPLITDEQGYWNIELIFQEIKKSLSILADRDIPIESIGITTWGNDFSLLAVDGQLINPFIRNNLTQNDSVEAFTKKMSPEKIYGQTGVLISQNNSLFQIYALRQIGYEPLKKAKSLLFMPDIFNYLLTGIIQTEFSIASTSQLYNPVKRMWDHDILRTVGIPVGIMPHIAESGSTIGSVSNNVSYETGIARIPVVTVAALNSSSAIAALPAQGNNWAFITTGKECQVGFESPLPMITKKSQQFNFTNEGGAGHTFHIRKIVTGLLLFQECHKAWNGSNYSFEEMVKLANTATPFSCFIDTDHASILESNDIPKAIADYCTSTNQKVPETHGEIIRAIIESVVFKFRIAIDQIETLRGLRPEVIYVTGESPDLAVLNQFTANCCGIPVIETIAEATRVGNIMVQALALGIVKNIAEIREITGKSFSATTFIPLDTEAWNVAFGMYIKTLNQEF